MSDRQLINFPLYLAEPRAKENEEKSRQELQRVKEMFIMYDDYQEPAGEVAKVKNEKKVANQNLELFELLVQEKRFSADLNIQLCGTKKSLLSLQTDWRKLQERYNEVKARLTAVLTA